MVDVMTDLAAVLRLQTFLARMEGMALGGQALQIAAATQDELLPFETETGTEHGVESAPDAGVSSLAGVGGTEAELSGRPVKKARLDGGERVLANGDVAHGSYEPHGTLSTSDASNGTGSISWRWECNGTVQLSHYGPMSATLQYRAPASATASCSTSSSSQQGAQELRLQVSWQRAAMPPVPKPVPGRSTRAAADPTLQVPQLVELVTCHVEGATGSETSGRQRTAQSTAAAGAVGVGVAGALGTSGTQASMPVSALLRSLSEMADMGEEGLLLDALQIAARPMMEIQAASAAIAAGVQGNGRAEERQVSAGSKPLMQLAHIADGAPFKHRMLAQLPRPLPAVPQGTLAAGGCLTVDVTAAAVGRSWVRLSFLPKDPAAGQAAAGGENAADGALLAAVQTQLLQQLGPAAIHVSHTWSSVASVPRSLQAPGSEHGFKQLWFLVATAQLCESLLLVMRCASSCSVAVKKQEY